MAGHGPAHAPGRGAAGGHRRAGGGGADADDTRLHRGQHAGQRGAAVPGHPVRVCLRRAAVRRGHHLAGAGGRGADRGGRADDQRGAGIPLADQEF